MKTIYRLTEVFRSQICKKKIMKVFIMLLKYIGL